MKIGSRYEIRTLRLKLAKEVRNDPMWAKINPLSARPLLEKSVFRLLKF